MTQHFTELRPAARTYIVAIIVLGAAAIVRSLTSLILQPVGFEWLVLAALTLLTGSFSMKVPSVSARISVSEAFVIAGVLAFGPHVATVIVVLDSLVLTSWLRGPSRSPLRALFNMSAGALAISSAAQLFAWLLPVYPAASAPLDQLLVPVFALAISYFIVNSLLIALAVAADTNRSPIDVWQQHFPWLSLNYLGGASIALILVSYTRDLNLTAVAVVVPLLAVIYLTFRTSWGRLEDAHAHVTQLNELYISTIETLAMAVDAKDQITHGHIRRVQVYAVELAKRIGVADARQIKAIEAAALLHDMGKLGIPEHILNKPGRLTGTEFDRMKQHADLGADLLSSIPFPYPVVPIVRHHHENWDGAGYPTGIAGTDIPLGARILSVVDCFDALTSDRPYRPRLGTDEAFDIIRERRGTMYDPLVVDTFIRAYPEIAPAAIRAGQEARSVFPTDIPSAITASVPQPLVHIRATATESALLMKCTQDIGKATSARAALEASAQSLRQLLPATVYALFEYDPKSDSLICNNAVDDPQNLLRGLVIPVGERVTGWCAANDRTAVNSDASLDLAQISQLFQPPLRSTISTPLTDGDRLVAVLTAYSLKAEAFTETHRYAFEHVGSALLGRLSSLQPQASSNLVAFPIHS
jgi:putative nucleotidyltransferase with HDIG domain